MYILKEAQFGHSQRDKRRFVSFACSFFLLCVCVCTVTSIGTLSERKCYYCIIYQVLSVILLAYCSDAQLMK